MPETSTTDWLKEHAPEGARIGYDPWLHTRDWVKKAKEALASRGAELVAVDANPIDEIWTDRPEASKAHLVVQPDQYAGKSAAEKRTEIGDWLAKQHADAAVLSALDSIAWAFNIRGADVTHTPVALAYALVNADGTADLFVAGEKIGARRAPASRQRRPPPRARRSSRARSASSRARRSWSIPSARSPRSSRRSRRPAPRSSPLRDPTILPKAIKNPAEIAGQKAAQARDGAVDLALPALDRRGGAQGRGRRAQGLRPSRSAAPRKSRAARPVVRQHFRRRAQRRDRPLQVEREDQPQARDRARSI